MGDLDGSRVNGKEQTERAKWLSGKAQGHTVDHYYYGGYYCAYVDNGYRLGSSHPGQAYLDAWLMGFEDGRGDLQNE